MSHPLRADPFVAAEIEAALAPYVPSLTAAELEWARDELADVLERDPDARSALEAALPRAEDRSGERLRPGVLATKVGERKEKAG